MYVADDTIAKLYCTLFEVPVFTFLCTGNLQYMESTIYAHVLDFYFRSFAGNITVYIPSSLSFINSFGGFLNKKSLADLHKNSTKISNNIITGISGPRYITPQRSSEVMKKILILSWGATPCMEAQRPQVALALL